METQVGFIGLGNIGRPMATNIQKRFPGVLVHDLSRDRIDTLVEAGAMAAGSIADLAKAARVVLLSLPTSNEVEAVLLGDGGLVANAAAGTLVIDLTSGSPPRSKSIATRLAERGIRYIDAGVSGGIAGATAATLGIMIGGSDQDVADATPYLEALGKTIVHMGPVGAGHATKALNNLLLAVNTVAVSEVMALAVKSGLDAGKVMTAINGSSGRSYVTDVRFPRYVMKGDYSHAGGMALALLLKDVAIACETARANETQFFMGTLVHQLIMRIGGELGLGAPNHSIAKAIEGWAGVEIRGQVGE
ncbi:MAG: NAD(P)-dependent oxidoreductase [Hyphomicrobiaceae bacterium]|nr:NAD(P)-dependent oxidoreductase [Hyphomicrobiaceae bacterium]